MIIAYLSVSGFYIINANQYNILEPSKILFNKKVCSLVIVFPGMYSFKLRPNCFMTILLCIRCFRFLKVSLHSDVEKPWVVTDMQNLDAKTEVQKRLQDMYYKLHIGSWILRDVLPPTICKNKEKECKIIWSTYTWSSSNKVVPMLLQYCTYLKTTIMSIVPRLPVYINWAIFYYVAFIWHLKCFHYVFKIISRSMTQGKSTIM